MVDGSYHDVDSSEMAFKIAGSMAFKDGVKKCNPVLLEPMMKVEVEVPEDFLGSVIGDLSSRRGQVEGQSIDDGSLKGLCQGAPGRDVRLRHPAPIHDPGSGYISRWNSAITRRFLATWPKPSSPRIRAIPDLFPTLHLPPDSF